MLDQNGQGLDRKESVDSVLVLGFISLGMVVLTWAILVVMGAGRIRQAQQYDGKIKELDTKLALYASTEKTYTAIETSLAHDKKLRASRSLFGPTWSIIRDSVPSDVQFSSLSLGGDSTIRIVGMTKSLTSVAQFANELENKAEISVVTPLSVDRTPNAETFGFTLILKANTNPPEAKS